MPESHEDIARVLSSRPFSGKTRAAHQCRASCKAYLELENREELEEPEKWAAYHFRWKADDRLPAFFQHTNWFLSIVETARQSHTWQWASGHVRSRSEECMWRVLGGWRKLKKKITRFSFPLLLKRKSTSQILRVYLTGNEKRVRKVQH